MVSQTSPSHESTMRILRLLRPRAKNMVLRSPLRAEDRPTIWALPLPARLHPLHGLPYNMDSPLRPLPLQLLPPLQSISTTLHKTNLTKRRREVTRNRTIRKGPRRLRHLSPSNMHHRPAIPTNLRQLQAKPHNCHPLHFIRRPDHHRQMLHHGEPGTI